MALSEFPAPQLFVSQKRYLKKSDSTRSISRGSPTCTILAVRLQAELILVSSELSVEMLQHQGARWFAALAFSTQMLVEGHRSFHGGELVTKDCPALSAHASYSHDPSCISSGQEAKVMRHE